MNTKLKFALIRCYSKQGFALPIAMGLGLIMILIAATMMMRSQGDQVTASAQKNTAQNLTVAEAGIARTLSKLNLEQARPLLELAYDPDHLINSNTPDNQWASFTAPPLINSCDDTSKTASQLVPLTDNISSGASAGTYNLLAYRYDSANQTGTLLLEGQTNNGLQANSTIKVNLKIDRYTPPSGLGSMAAEDINLGQNDVIGSISCTSRTLCPLSCTTNPTLSELRTAIGASSSNAVITNPTSPSLNPVINIGSVTLPSVPSVPAGITPSNLGAVTQNATPLVIPSAAEIVTYTAAGYPAGTPYYYSISSINRRPIHINTSVIGSTPVYLYISGNINQQGNDDIRPVLGLPEPGQIRIYGASTNGTLPTSQTFSMSGNACTMGIDGGGSGCSSGAAAGANIFGAAWVKTFNVTVGNGSNSGIFKEQSGLMSVLTSSAPQLPKLSSLSAWQRQEVTH